MCFMTADLDAVNAECASTITAFLAGDLDAIKKQFTEDCVVTPPGTPPLKGLAGKSINSYSSQSVPLKSMLCFLLQISKAKARPN